MSTTIDQKVVEMRFDNKQFEQNIATTMSSLEKFKQKLNLTGATKGMEQINAAANKVDLSQLETTATRAGFHIQDVWLKVATVFEYQIARRIVNSAKSITSALTIEPIKTGLQEYETQINAVQTILANTESKGTTLGDVNAALDTLNEYADKTIYNFTEMTRNIGTFTAAGVNLDTSVNAIQGIANLAAVSGSNSQQASTAMYQLSQALASGTVKLMDWNSVVNAGMGGQVFQDALKETARVHGVAIDDMIKKNGSFRETLQEGWLTADILTETLSHFTMAAEEGSEQWNNYKKSLMDSGYSEEQANAILKLSNTATDAATKVKTATQLWDTLKETAQSGWTQTWEIIIGDFEEAKELWSGIYETLGPMIDATSKARNTLLEGAMTSNWDKMVAKINEAGIETTKFEEKLRSTAESHGIDVDKLIEEHGSLEKAFRSGAISSDILKEAIAGLEGKLIDLDSVRRNISKFAKGDDVKQIQKALSDLGYDIGKAGVDGNFGAATEKALKEFQKAKGLEVTGVVDENTIKALEEASGAAEGLSESVGDLISGIDKLGGRELLIESLKNVFEGVMSVVKPIKEAFTEIFPPTTVEQLYSFIEGINNFTKKLILGETASDNLKRTFKGLFAIVDIGKQALGAVLKAIGPLFGTVGDLGGGILETTASWGDWLVKLNETIEKSGFFTNAVEKMRAAFEKVRNFLQPVIDGIKDFGSTIGITFSEISSNATERLGPLTVLGNFIKNVFISIGRAIDKVFPYISAAATGIGNVLKSLMDKISESVQGADYDKLFDLANGGILTAIGVFIAKFIKSGGDILDGAGGFLENINGILEGVGDALGAFTESLKAKTLKEIAIAIGILAAALLVLSLIDSEKLTAGLTAITILFAEMLGAMSIFSKMVGGGTLMDSIKQMMNFHALGTVIKSLATSLLILAVALKIMSTMSWEEMGVGLISMTAALGAMVGVVWALPKEKELKGTSKAIASFAKSLVIMALALKIMGSMSWTEMGVALISMTAALGAMIGVVWALPKEKELAKASRAISSLAKSLVVMAIALKIMGSMSWEEMGVALISMAVALGAMIGVMWALPKDIGSKAAGILVFASALTILAAALKIMGSMSWEEMARGLIAMAVSLGAVIGVIWALEKTQNLAGTAASLVLLSAAILVLSAALKNIGSMSWEEMGRGLLTLAGAFVIIGVAGLLLGPIAPAILSLAGAVALLGVGILAAGVGVLAFAAGLTALAAALAASGGAITVFVASIISLIPYLIEQIGVGIIKLCEVIAGSTAAICDAFTVIILALVDAIVASVPALVEGILVLVEELLKSLVAHTPTIVIALFDFLIAIIDAIAAKLPDLIQAGVNLIMALFQGVIDALKSIDPTVLVNGILAIGMITALMAALAACAALAPAAMTGVLGVGVVIAELAVVLAAIGALAQIPGLDWLVSEGGHFMQTIGTAIGQFVGGIVGGIAQGITSSLPKIGSDLSAFMTNAKPFIDGAKSIDPSALDGVKSLVGVILALTGANIVESLTSWLTGGSSLTKFGEEIATFAPYIRTYADTVAGIDASAVTSSATAAQALAEMTSHIPNEGGVAAWFAGENSIAKFGTELISLGMGLKMYSLAITGFNAEAVIASANAAQALVDMTSNIPNEGGMVAWFTGENSISKFGKELVSLGMSLAMYSLAITGFNAEAVIASTNAAKALVDMTSSIPNEGGMVAWFTGENSVASWGTQLISLGNSLAMYSFAITGFNAEAVIASANAAKALVDMTSSIPNEGGMAAWFTGENSISKFGNELVSLGLGLFGFSIAVSGINVESMTAAANAAKTLSEMAANIPNEGGMAAWFTGDNSVAKFGTSLVSLGAGLKGFSDEVSGINAENVTAAANAAKSLAQMASVIPNEGGIKAWFTGDNSISSFGDKLPVLGEGLKGFSDAVAGIVPENITAAANAAKSLAQMAETTPKDTGKLKTFGENLVTFGEKLSSYFSKVDEISLKAITTSTKAIDTVKNAGAGLDAGKFSKASKAIDEIVKSINKLSKIKASAADGFSSAIKKIAESNVTSMIKAFENAGSKMNTAGKKLVTKFVEGAESQNSKINKAGKTLADNFVKGIEAQNSKAKSACKKLVTSGASAISNQANRFKSAGKDLGSGLVQGINSKKIAVYNAAYALGQKAVQGEKDGQKSNSPSKLTMQAGNWFGEGLVIGINQMANKVYKSSYNLGETATGTISSSISRIADAMSTDIDTQPTIRPVLDLSDVKAGAGAIGNMLDMGGSIGVMANVGTISSMMNRRSQNGVNDDVVSAIDKLRKDVGNLENRSYSIGGITYSSGDEVANAIETLVRAVRVEGRA